MSHALSSNQKSEQQGGRPDPVLLLNKASWGEIVLSQAAHTLNGQESKLRTFFFSTLASSGQPITSPVWADSQKKFRFHLDAYAYIGIQNTNQLWYMQMPCEWQNTTLQKKLYESCSNDHRANIRKDPCLGCSAGVKKNISDMHSLWQFAGCMCKRDGLKTEQCRLAAIENSI